MVDNVTLIKRDWQERINEMDRSLDHLQGPIVDLMIDPASQFIGQLTNDIQTTARKLSIDFASEMSSEELDVFAANFGVTRVQGSRARGTVYFKLQTPQNEDVTFPRGIRVSTSDNRYGYVTVDEVTLTTSQLPSYFNVTSQLFEIPLEVEAEDIGPEYRTSPFTITNIESADLLFRITAVENRTEITGGTLAEGDDKVVEAIKQVNTLKERGIPQGLINEIRNITGNNVTDAKLLSSNNGKAIKVFHILGQQLIQNEQIFTITDPTNNEFTFDLPAIHTVDLVVLNNRTLESFSYNFDAESQALYIDSSLLIENATLRVEYTYNSVIKDISDYLNSNETNLFGTQFQVSEGEKVPLEVAIELQLQATFKFLNVEPNVRKVVLEYLNPTLFTSVVYREKLIDNIKSNVAGVVGVTVNIFRNLDEQSSVQVEVIEFNETQTPSLQAENLAIR